MRHYYYVDNDQQFGPFTVDELKSKRLKKSTLVWTDGMHGWVTADDIGELKDILISEPPPIPKRYNSPPLHPKYDPNYEKPQEATGWGVMLLICIMCFSFAITYGAITNEATLIIVAICSLIMRIIVMKEVVNIAEDQNRNTTGWGCFALLSPSLALIIIGQLRKLKNKA